MRALVQLTALILAAGLVLHSAIASNQATSDTKHRQDEAFREYKIALAERLSTDSQPRRRMAAAILIKVEAQLAAASRANPGFDNFKSARFPASLDPDELVGSALTQAPDDPLLLWIAATNCPASASVCAPERSLDHLRELQPDNAMVWLQGSAIEHPEKRNAETITATANDAVDEDTRLRNIAKASRVDGFHWDIQRMLLDAFLQRPLPDELLEAGDFATPTQEKMAVIAAIGYEMAFVTPHYGLATKLCGGDAIDDYSDSRRELCIAALGNIAKRADTMMAERLSLSRLLPLLPEGEERDAVEAKQRQSRWQQLAYAELLIPRSGRSNEMDAEAERHIALLHDGTTELATMREALTEAGISLEPPRGWTSPYDDPVVH
ncbi:MAG: hypothetical protein KDI75_03405 [Xanthomonadales bacterium]|nr:hypothetical protein [Xanthomonadales bacterium]